MQDLNTFPPTSTLSQSEDLDQQLILGTQTSGNSSVIQFTVTMNIPEGEGGIVTDG